MGLSTGTSPANRCGCWRSTARSSGWQRLRTSDRAGDRFPLRASVSPDHPDKESCDMNRHLRLVLLATLLAALACSFPSTPGAPSESAPLGEPSLSPEAPGPGETEPPATEVPLPPVVEPVFRIVYTNAGNVWVLEQDGSSHQLTADGMASDVLISSDGARIAYLLRAAPDFHGELRAIN